MSLQIATIANSISRLSVSGLTLLDVDEIPPVVDPRVSTLLPLPNYITDFEMVRDSFGSSDAKMTVVYTLNYRLFYKPVGTGRITTIEGVSGLVEMVGLVLDAVLAIDTLDGAVDITPQDVTNMGIVNDPSDNQWHGCDIALRVTEFVN